MGCHHLFTKEKRRKVIEKSLFTKWKRSLLFHKRKKTPSSSIHKHTQSLLTEKNSLFPKKVIIFSQRKKRKGVIKKSHFTKKKGHHLFTKEKNTIIMNTQTHTITFNIKKSPIHKKGHPFSPKKGVINFSNFYLKRGSSPFHKGKKKKGNRKFTFYKKRKVIVFSQKKKNSIIFNSQTHTITFNTKKKSPIHKKGHHLFTKEEEKRGHKKITFHKRKKIPSLSIHKHTQSLLI